MLPLLMKATAPTAVIVTINYYYQTLLNLTQIISLIIHNGPDVSTTAFISETRKIRVRELVSKLDTQ